MNIISDSKISAYYARLDSLSSTSKSNRFPPGAPVHVVYGGAHLFNSDTPEKLGRIALRSISEYAPNFAAFARAMWLKGADALPHDFDSIEKFEKKFTAEPENLECHEADAFFAWNVYQKTIEKLRREPIEDFRIDFEDGYGFRADAEEDAHAIAASTELAKSFLTGNITAFCGFRVKAFAPETFRRAVRTLDLFLTNLLEITGGRLPENFVVTLPKVAHREEVEILGEILSEFEKKNDLPHSAIAIEILIETPLAVINEKGEVAVRKLVEAGNGRVNSAHFGAYDYTASLGIAGIHQHLKHEACVFARQMMLVSLSPLNIRISDSVTTEMPVAIHKSENLTGRQLKENKNSIEKAWRRHFNNVTNSLINGFYQSWDLHPAQLVARYAAVYAFFLEAQNSQAVRLKGFIEKATQAMTTGNTFDDAASAQGLLNFFARGLNCGAFDDGKEIYQATGLTVQELTTKSFMQIMKRRLKESV